MSKLSFILKKLWAGQSVTRAYYDWRLSKETLRGHVIDIGGGHDGSYLDFMKREPDTKFVTFDVKTGQTTIDFESDRLPAADSTYDTVLFLNVLEHIYNYQHITSEVLRIKKTDGQLIGVVPFLMWYHADPHDFFRYTHEALERILVEAGASAEEILIEPIGAGPFVAAAQMFIQSIPFRPLRPVVFLPFYAVDALFSLIKRGRGRVYALGYLFIVSDSVARSKNALCQ